MLGFSITNLNHASTILSMVLQKASGKRDKTKIIRVPGILTLFRNWNNYSFLTFFGKVHCVPLLNNTKSGISGRRFKN